MRKCLVGFVAVGFLFLSVSSVWSKGIFITPGVKANGLGGAFIGIADDPTAIYWNPAGLVQSKDSGVHLSAFYTASNATGNQALRNASIATIDSANGDFPLPRIYDSSLSPLLPNAEPASFNSKEFKTTALVPFAAGYTNYKGITLALGFYGVGGGGGKWEDSVSAAAPFTADTINASINATQAFMVGNISAAKELSPKVSVGLGVDIIQMTDNTKVNKAYVKSATSLLPALVPGYNATIENTASGTGIQVNGGAMYKILENLQAGLVFRSGTTIKLTGKTKIDQTGVPIPGLSASSEYNFDQNYAYPMTYGIGVAYNPTKAWTIAFGVDQNMYSVLKNNVDYATLPPTPLNLVIKDVDKSLSWKDTTQLRLGAEYRCCDRWALRAGVQNDPSVYSEKLTLINTNQYSFIYATVGAGYRFGAVSVDLSYANGISDKPELAGRSYEYPLNIFRLGANYSF
ncbi:MAG: OmpP1/FadL family transporter [Endomicrobiales bacterium]